MEHLPVQSVVFTIAVVAGAAATIAMRAPQRARLRASLLGAADVLRSHGLRSLGVTAAGGGAIRASNSDAEFPLSERLSLDDQWDRTCWVITDAIARTETVETLQRSAGQQLDAATYALQRLVAELSGVVRMPLQAEEQPAGRSVVHHLVVPAPGHERGAAIAA